MMHGLMRFSSLASAPILASLALSPHAWGSTNAPVVSLSATSVVFSSQNVGVASAAKTVTLSNTGHAPLTIGSFVLAGANASSFLLIDNCAKSLGAGAECTLSLRFEPKAAGAATASVLITDNASGSPQLIGLKGTGNKLAATPAFAPGPGTYTSAQSVSITDATAGAAIYYTTNGSAPTTASARYTKAIEVSKSETLGAIAVAAGYSQSEVVSAAYTIEGQAATPVIAPAGGSSPLARTVTISDALPGATIYFTTSGATPTTASRQYMAAITVNSTETIKAIAIAPGYSRSAVASAKFTVGSNPDQRADLLLSRMTEAEKLQLVHGNLPLPPYPVQPPRGAVYWVPGIPSLGIPDQLSADGPAGLGDNVGQATALPSPLANAASWDLTEAYKYGVVIGKETRAFGLNINLGGNTNLTSREPRDGRTFETGGEDPYLSGEINAQHLLGVQDQNVIAGTKHYALNDQETGRTQANAVIDERAARESDLLAFEVALADSDAQMAMCAYSLVNGTYNCQNDPLLNGVLKGDLGFNGFVLSDDYATQSSVPSALAGLDQEQSYGYLFNGIWTAESLADALANGDMPVSRLNSMVHRILRGMYAAGLFDHPAKVAPVDASGDAAIALEIEEQGAVLLKNNGAQLPLNPSTAQSIAVIGSHADLGVLSGGGSAQVTPVGGAALTLPPACPPNLPPPGGMACTNASEIYDPSPPLAAIKAIAPHATVKFNDGTNASAAAALAASSNLAIVFVNDWESEGMDRVSLNFSPSQDALVEAVAAANPHTVVVLENGGAHLMPWLASVRAVLEAWYPGQQGGKAIANLLFGAVTPSGKLPITFPASVRQLPRPVIPSPSATTGTFDVNYNIEGFNVGYKWFQAQNLQPLFAFGYGLSYTAISISNLQLTPDSPPANGFQVSFELKNTGNLAGAEVAQVYLGFPVGMGEPPMRLVGWRKVLLQPGAEQLVTVTVDATAASHPLSYWNANATPSLWAVAPGDYTVFVGNSSDNVKSAGTFHIAPHCCPVND
jgi:beta-glucosidase